MDDKKADVSFTPIDVRCVSMIVPVKEVYLEPLSQKGLPSPRRPGLSVQPASTPGVTMRP